MSRQFFLGLFAVGVVLFLLWGPLRVLLFGGSLDRGAAGEWVGTMTIPESYPRPGAPGAIQSPLQVPLKAAIYMKLSSSDGFMREYSGPGEIQIAGGASAIPFRLGSFRIHTPEIRAQGAFISKGFLETTLGHCTFQSGLIHLENTAMGSMSDGVSFTADLHRGTKATYQEAVQSLNK